MQNSRRPPHGLPTRHFRPLYLDYTLFFLSVKHYSHTVLTAGNAN